MLCWEVFLRKLAERILGVAIKFKNHKSPILPFVTHFFPKTFYLTDPTPGRTIPNPSGRDFGFLLRLILSSDPSRISGETSYCARWFRSFEAMLQRFKRATQRELFVPLAKRLTRCLTKCGWLGQGFLRKFMALFLGKHCKNLQLMSQFRGTRLRNMWLERNLEINKIRFAQQLRTVWLHTSKVNNIIVNALEFRSIAQWGQLVPNTMELTTFFADSSIVCWAVL